MLTALVAAILVALVSLVGVFFFGNNSEVIKFQKYVIPTAVGVFLSLVLINLIPETLELSPNWGGVAIAFGFISFYILSNLLHKKFHQLGDEDCERKGSAVLILVGDAIHNAADGVVLGGAFLIDPTIGIATAITLAMHEVPQEIFEFGILVNAGYTRTKAALLNLISASSIVLGLIVMLFVAEYAAEYMWLLAGIAAGNLLFLAASDLLPRIHSDTKIHGNMWYSVMSIVVGFVVMTTVIMLVPEQSENMQSDEQSTESSSR